MSDTAATTETSTAPVDLNINDIQNALRVIDFACDQGAFKGWDTISQVAQVRGRLVAFLQSVAPAPAEGEAEPEAAPAPDAPPAA